MSMCLLPIFSWNEELKVGKLPDRGRMLLFRAEMFSVSIEALLLFSSAIPLSIETLLLFSPTIALPAEMMPFKIETLSFRC